MSRSSSSARSTTRPLDVARDDRRRRTRGGCAPTRAEGADRRGGDREAAGRPAGARRSTPGRTSWRTSGRRSDRSSSTGNDTPLWNALHKLIVEERRAAAPRNARLTASSSCARRMPQSGDRAASSRGSTTGSRERASRPSASRQSERVAAVGVFASAAVDRRRHRHAAGKLALALLLSAAAPADYGMQRRPTTLVAAGRRRAPTPGG